MFAVISCLGATHDWRFVAGAITVCLVGAFSTVIMLVRAQECLRKHTRLWIAAAALTGGISIWATHFIAMLAYDGGYPVAYDAGATALSVLVSIAVSWVAFSAAFRGSETPGIVLAGGLFGIGIAAMHFTGMNAVEARGHLSYAPGPTASALASGVLFGSLALMAVRLLTGRRRVVVGTMLVTATVCALHFTSMGGVTLMPDPSIGSAGALLIDRAALAAIVAAVSSAIVLVGGAAALMDRHLTDVRGLANATMEGLLFVQDEKIVEVNESMLEVLGVCSCELLGRSVHEILPDLEIYWSGSTTGKARSLGQLLRSDGSRVEVEVLGREVEYRGRQILVFAVRDLTERRKSERLIDHLARHDPLTGLANRREFDNRLAKLMRDQHQHGHQLALICLDLDNFKGVNDLRGHAAGDALLRLVAGVLTRAIGENDFVARLGGDEFAIVQVGRPQPGAAQDLADAVLRGVADIDEVDGQRVSFGTSLGVALGIANEISAELLHGRADAALYEAKKAGRGIVKYFDTALEERLKLRQQAEADLLGALSRHEFRIDYRPFVSEAGGTILGYKAQVRWNHSSRGSLEASEFLPHALECGLANQIIYWIIEHAVAEAQSWRSDLAIAIDLSCFQHVAPGCYEEISRIIRRSGIDPRGLDLVISEAALSRGVAGSSSMLQLVHNTGIGIIVTDLLFEQSAMANLNQVGSGRIRADADSIATYGRGFDPQLPRAALEFLRSAGMEIIANHT